MAHWKKQLQKEFRQTFALPADADNPILSNTLEYLHSFKQDPRAFDVLLKSIKDKMDSALDARKDELKQLEARSAMATPSVQEAARAEEIKKFTQDLILARDAARSRDIADIMKLVMAGMQLTHNQLKGKAYTVPPLGWSLSTVGLFCYAPEHVAEDGSKQIGKILIHPEVLSTFARARARAQDPLIADVEGFTRVCRDIVDAGMEESYHAFQLTNPQKKAEINKGMQEVYGDTDLAGERQRRLRAAFAVHASDPQHEILRKAFYDADPLEIDARQFKEKHGHTVDTHVAAFLKNTFRMCGPSLQD